MTGKYIVELKDRETLYKAAIGGNGEPYISTAMKNVYKEPDLEAIRDEAYEKGVQDTKQHWVDAPRSCAYKLGYENGLKAAWDAARKIESLSAREFNKAFTGYDDCFKVFENYTPQEAIEKIKQCGQEQEEIEYDYQWHADGTSEPEYHITACRPFPNYYHPGCGWSAKQREITDGIIREVIYTADDEIPKCGLCDHFCDDYDCSKYCGAEHGWHWYERVVYLSEEE